MKAWKESQICRNLKQGVKIPNGKKETKVEWDCEIKTWKNDCKMKLILMSDWQTFFPVPLYNVSDE